MSFESRKVLWAFYQHCAFSETIAFTAALNSYSSIPDEAAVEFNIVLFDCFSGYYTFNRCVVSYFNVNAFDGVSYWLFYWIEDTRIEEGDNPGFVVIEQVQMWPHEDPPPRTKNKKWVTHRQTRLEMIAMIANLAVQSSTRTLNHTVILLIEASKMLHTTKLFR